MTEFHEEYLIPTFWYERNICPAYNLFFPDTDYGREALPILEDQTIMACILWARQITPENPDLVHLLAIRTQQLIKVHAGHLHVVNCYDLLHVR